MKGPLLSLQLPLQGASQPMSGRPTTYLAVGTLFSTVHALNQWGKGGPCFILWNDEMDTKSINLHWIHTNRNQAGVLSAWCNLKTEYSRLLRNTDSNSVSPLVCGLFSIVSTTTLHSLRLVESLDVEEPHTWVHRARCKLYTSFPLHRGLVLLTTTLLKSWDFPGGPVAKTSYTKCRGPVFNPWSGN